MAKIALTKSKLSSGELDRLLGDVSMDTENRSDTTKAEHEIVSATNINGGDVAQTDVSATNNIDALDVSATNISRGKYANQYRKEHYDTLRINLPKGAKAVLQREAEARNVSVTNMILTALEAIGVSVTNNEKSADVSSTNIEV